MRSTAPSFVMVPLLALAACTPVPAPTPSPLPTYLCTPEAGGASAPCTAREHEDMLAKDALYAEAERVFRDFVVKDTRITFHSAESAPSARLLEVMFESLAIERGEAFRLVRDQGLSGGAGQTQVVWVKRASGLVREGSLVAIETCTDASGIPVLSNGKPTGATGQRVRTTSYYKRDAGKLKISAIEGQRVASC